MRRLQFSFATERGSILRLPLEIGAACRESILPVYPSCTGASFQVHLFLNSSPIVQIILAMAAVQAIKPCAKAEVKLRDGQKAPPAGQQAIAVDATLASRQAQICSADMAAVRVRLTAEQSKRCSDETINRFLRATLSNVDQVGLQLCSLTVHCWQGGQPSVASDRSEKVHWRIWCLQPSCTYFCAGALQIWPCCL